MYYRIKSTTNRYGPYGARHLTSPLEGGLTTQPLGRLLHHQDHGTITLGGTIVSIGAQFMLL